MLPTTPRSSRRKALEPGAAPPSSNGRPHYEPELYGRRLAFPRPRVAAARLATLLALGTGGVYLSWRLSTLDGTGGLGVAFYAVEAANYLSLALTALLLWRLRWRTGPGAPPRGTLDIYVTVCGEPVEIVERTIRAALAIAYPHDTYVLNDGRVAGKPNWRAVEELAERYGVPCFTRTSGARGKAGNLNHALARTRGEFVAVIDADHRPRPELAEETLGYFASKGVAFVCTPQQFDADALDVLGNRETLFYTSVQPAKDVSGCAFSCGNGAVYRRSALESIGGFSDWNIVEDVHTSLELHAGGWTSVYHPRPITTGIAPQTAAALAEQRLRWATDSLRILFWDNPLLKRGLRLSQRLHYLQTAGFYLVAATQVLFVLGPALYLLWRIPVMRFSGPEEYALHGVPYYASILLFLVAYGGLRGALRVVQQQLFLSPVYCLAVLGAATRVHFGSGVTEKRRILTFSPILVPQAAGLALCGAGIVAAFLDPGDGVEIAAVWAAWTVFALASFATAVSSPLAARSLRVAARAAAAAGLAAVFVVGVAEGPRPAPSLEGAAPPPAPAAQPAPPPPAEAPSPAPPPAEPVAPAPAPPAEPTRLATPSEGAYLGVFNPSLLTSGVAVEGWNERHLAQARIVSWYQQWGSGERRFRTDWLEMIAAQGAVPMITWEPWSKPPGTLHRAVQPDYRLEVIAGGRYDDLIRTWARAAAAYERPLLIRFMHEMNGSWYPWSIRRNENTEAGFVAAWRHVHDIFVEEGATNVSWVWTLNSFAGLSRDNRDLDAYYPGDEYVDWVSATGFNWGNTNNWHAWRSVDEVFNATYQALARFGKPVMISEIGTVADGGDVKHWMRYTLARLERGYPLVKAVVWFDSDYPGDADFRLAGRTDAAFRSGLSRSDYWSPAIALAPAPAQPSGTPEEPPASS